MTRGGPRSGTDATGRTGRRSLSGARTLLVVAASPFLALALGPATPGSSGLEAQVVRGYVVDDSTATPLPDAVVSVMIDSLAFRRATTDSTGWFSFLLDDSATVQLEGRRLGWRTVLSQPLHVGATDTVEVELWMGIQAIPVAPLYVTARSNLGRSRFYRHMEEWGRGVFMTPEMIDSIAPIHPVDVLRDQEKTWLTWRMGPRGALPNIRTFLGSGCVKFMIDGREVRSLEMAGPAKRDATGGRAFYDSPLEQLEGRQIVAVEYYRYIGEVPEELRRWAYTSNNMCGLVVYWTEAGW